MVHFRKIFGPQKESWPKSTSITYFDQFFGIGTKLCVLRVHLLNFQSLGVSRLGGPDCQNWLGGDFSRKSNFLAHFRHLTTFEARVAFKHISFSDLDQ